MIIFVKFQDGKEMNARVQCKMYSLKEKDHVKWGTCLKNLQIDCKVRDGQNVVDVKQVLFKWSSANMIPVNFKWFPLLKNSQLQV